MRIHLDTGKIEDYRLFLKVKSLPRYTICGHVAEFPDEYAHLLAIPTQNGHVRETYRPLSSMFDYQAAVASLAVRKKKFACFLECGLGKSLVLLDYAHHVAEILPPGQCVLIVSPLMVIKQTMAEAVRFYPGGYDIEQVRAANLRQWLLTGKGRVGITNYEAITEEIESGRLGCLILDESAMLASHYGKWGKRLIRIGRGLEWKLALTGTPAPNDRIEYANHAVFLDHFPNTNAFLARFFVNRGQTQNRWELKPHALRPFYRALSHWSIFMTNPGTYGWKDNSTSIPPIHVHIHDVPLTDEQRELTMIHGGDMYGAPGGITSRTKLAQIAKGNFRGKKIDSAKPAFIRNLVDGWPDESTIIWTLYNKEQESMSQTFPDAASISGNTPMEERERLVGEFQRGERKVLISKPKILGLGLNLHIATRQVFSGLQDSFMQFHQAVKRSNRVRSSRDLNVHIPVTDVERPMMETVLTKAHRVQQDNEEQEIIFKENSVCPI